MLLTQKHLRAGDFGISDLGSPGKGVPIIMELQAGNGMQEEQSSLPVANKKYKDTICRMLFSDKKNLLSLYNALNGKNYSDCDKLEIVTLENAIYMSMKNDLAFILDLDLFLWEHQSTYNRDIQRRTCIGIEGPGNQHQ